MANEIGTAYLIVQAQLDSSFEADLNAQIGSIGDVPVMILPEVESGAIESGIDESVDSSEPAITAKAVALGALIASGIEQGVQGALDLAGALPDLGLKFQKSQAILRVGTGATNDELERMNDLTNAIFAQSPAPLNDIAATMALVHDRTDLADLSLGNVTNKIIQLSRITGSDLPTLTDDATALFNQWSIGPENMVGSLDTLLKASEESGIGVTDLTGQLNGAGLQLRSLGFNFEDSVALISNLSESGLDLSVTTAAFRKALTLAAKEGKPANEVFKSIFEQIRDAPDDTKAAAVAVENFGARGVTMATAIREGRFAWEDMAQSIDENKDTISDAAGDVSNWGSKWEILKHKAELAFKPIASGLADTLTGIGAFAGDVWTTFQREGWEAAWDKVADKADVIWNGDAEHEGIKQKLGHMVEGIPGWVSENAPIILGTLAGGLFGAFTGWAAGLWLGDDNGEGIKTKLDNFIANVGPWVTEQGDKVTGFLSGLIDSFVNWGDRLWDGDETHEGLGTKLNRLTDPEGPLVTWISEAPGKLGPVFKGWGDAAVRWVTTLWDGDPETGRQGIHQGFDKLIEDMTTWVDEQSGEKMVALGGKLLGAMMLGGLLALQIGIKLIGSYTEFALKAVFLTILPGLFDLGHSLGRALRGFVKGFLDGLPGPLKTLLESAPTIGPIIKEMEIASNLMEGEHALGGMVGGPTGAAALAIVHGGERVLTAQQNAELGLGTGFTPASSSGDGFTLVQHIAGQEPERTAQKTVTAMREEYLTRGTGR